MPAETIRLLNCRPGKIYADCTLGGTGHSKLIIRKIIPDGLLIGIDQDMDAIINANKVLDPHKANVRLFHDNFINLPQILSKLHIPAIDGILLDLGLSLHHIEASGRGFSFQRNEPLDMRMDTSSKIKAEDLINSSNENKLAAIFFELGEERYSKRIARAIVRERKTGRIETSGQLSKIVCSAIPGKPSAGRRIHPATRVFMALRIAVNRELERLNAFMDKVPDMLNQGGRICVLAFHSLEDRIVKHKIKDMAKGCTCPPDFPECACGKKAVLFPLTKKVLKPSAEEIEENPMARSTRLRSAEKL